MLSEQSTDVKVSSGEVALFQNPAPAVEIVADFPVRDAVVHNEHFADWTFIHLESPGFSPPKAESECLTKPHNGSVRLPLTTATVQSFKEGLKPQQKTDSHALTR